MIDQELTVGDPLVSRARFRTDDYGKRVDEIEILGEPPPSNYGQDDFAFDCQDNAYISTHLSSVFKYPRNKSANLDSRGLNDTLLIQPTSAALHVTCRVPGPHIHQQSLAPSEEHQYNAHL